MPTARLRGPIAYLNRVTEGDIARRRIRSLTIRRPLPLVLETPSRPGLITDVKIEDDVVWAEATMPTTDPVGTRYGVMISVADTRLKHVDADGAELPDLLLDGSAICDFLEADLMGASLTEYPAWPDAHLEIISTEPPPPDPLTEFKAAVTPEGQGPLHFVFSALLALDALGWLARPPTPLASLPYHNPDQQRALRALLDALYGADGQGLDPVDAYPPVALWCLRLNGHLHPVPGLDNQLYDWRLAAEDAAGERFHWLPSFPEQP